MEENYSIIETREALTDLVANLIATKDQIAIDFECEFNLHRYGMHLCLIQLFDGTSYYLIDTVKITNLAPVKRLFHSKLLKIMFAAKGDLCLLYHLYGFHIKNVFDIQIAAKLLEYEILSLGGIIEKSLGVHTSKSKSKQKANWNKRPLSPVLIEYAIDDVKYLMQLAEKFRLLAEAQGHKLALMQQNKELEHAQFRDSKSPHLKIKNAHTLNAQGRKNLSRFFKVRNELAKKLDLSPHFLLSNEALIAISRHVPETRADWLSLKGLNKKAIPYLDRFIKAVKA